METVLKDKNDLILAILRKDGLEIPDAFVTGSQAFGWATSDSDVDICIHQVDMAGATARLQELCQKIESSGYNSGKKGTIHGMEINLIPLHPLDMICWWLATQEIRRLAAIRGVASRLGSKEMKHGYFEMLRGFYKAAVPYNGSEEAVALLRKLMLENA